jgi:hypothetical protein
VSRTVYIRGGDASTRWAILFVFLCLSAAAGLAYYFKYHLNRPRVNVATAGEEGGLGTPYEETIPVIPEIIPDPEKDDPRPIPEETHGDYDDFTAPPEEVPPPPPPKPAGPPPKPVLIKKYIPSEIPRVKMAISQGRTVDILILYTRATKDKLRGPEGVLAHANSVVAYTNMKFGERGVKGRLRLVGLVEVDYVSGGNLRDDIRNMSKNKVKSHYDTVRQLRDKTGADIVCLFSKFNSRGGGGLAEVKGVWSAMDFPVQAIFRHEMQHNFGWNHGDRTNLSMIDANYPQLARWNRTRVTEGKLYLQYWGTADEAKKQN